MTIDETELLALPVPETAVTPTPKRHCLYLVRVFTRVEATQWISAGSPAEAELLAEADFNFNGRRNFTTKEETVDDIDILDHHQFAGLA